MAGRELSSLDQIMNLLGLARRAGILSIGQDNVFAALKKRERLLVLTASDASVNVMRRLDVAVQRGAATQIALDAVDRNTLGAQIGVSAAQIAALPSNNGLAIKILNIYENKE